MHPEKLQNWAKKNRANIYCSEAPTCKQSALDFFVVHRSLADAVIGTQLIADLGGRPHSGFPNFIRFQMQREADVVPKKPAQIPGSLSAGCKFHKPSFHLAAALTENPTTAEVSDALRQWYDSADSELIDMMGLDTSAAVAYRGRADGPSFVGRVLGACGGQLTLQENSEVWPLGQLSCCERPTSTTPPSELATQVEALRTKMISPLNWKTADNETLKQILEVTALLDEERLGDSACLAYIIKAAIANAHWI